MSHDSPREATRRPAPIEMVGGKGKRQRIWEAIRRLASDRAGAAFTEAMIFAAIPRAERIDIEMTAIADYRRALVAGDILAVEIAPAPRRAGAWRLIRDAGLEAPRLTRHGKPVTQGLAQEQMWRTLRLLPGDLNARELAAHASTEAVPVHVDAAKDYLLHLAHAGYLVCTAPGKGLGAGGVQARYRLKPSRNTGPRPPMICRTKVVWDPNENRVVWQPRVTEEDAVDVR